MKRNEKKMEPNERKVKKELSVFCFSFSFHGSSYMSKFLNMALSFGPVVLNFH